MKKFGISRVLPGIAALMALIALSGCPSTPQYDLTMAVEGQGTVSPDVGTHTYDEGETVTLEAFPATDWRFDGWSGAATGNENPTSITMTSNQSVTAHFVEEDAPETYALNVTVEGEGQVTLDPDPDTGLFEAGAEVTLTATPEAGWQFTGWSGDEEGGDATLTLIITQDTNLTATFEQETITGKSAPVGITGWVTDTEGNGIPFAEVRLENSETVYTNAEGLYLFGELDAASDVTLFFTAELYTTNTRTIDIVPGATTSANVSLKALAEAKTLSNAQDGGEVADDLGNKVILPANALVNGENKAVVGDVDVRITPLDVMDPNEMNAFPGDFRAIAAMKSDEVVQLETFALADYQFTQDGEPLNLATDANAEIYLQLPEDTPLQEGDLVPLWFFDEEEGIWYEDGNGIVESDGAGGLHYRADVSHFSWWNCDLPITETHNFTGEVLDEDGNPVAGARVESDGVDYAGRSSTVTDENGFFCINVKRNSTVEISVTLPGSAVVTDSIIVDVPDEASNCSVGGGSTLERPLSADFDSAIQGEVLDTEGNPIADIDIYSSFGGRAVTDSEGYFCLGAPANREVTVYAAGRFPVKATTLPNTSCAAGDAVFVTIQVTPPEDGDHVGYIFSTVRGGVAWDGEVEVYVEGLASGAFFFASSIPGVIADWLQQPGDVCTVEVETISLDGGFDFDFEIEFPDLVDALDPGRFGEVSFQGETALMIRFYDMLLGLIETPTPFLLGAYMQDPEILASATYGDTVTYSWPGGLDIDAFAIDVTLPGALNVTKPEYTVQATGKPQVEIDFESDLELEWDATLPGDLVQLVLQTSITTFSPMQITTGVISCILVDDGSYTLSSDYLEQLPQAEGGTALQTTTLTLTRISAHTVPAPLRAGGEGILTVFTTTEFEADVNTQEFLF